MERLSALDAAFLSIETPTMHMHVMAVSVLDPSSVEGGVSADTLRRLIEARLDRIPPFRRRLVNVPFGVHRPLWVEDPTFDLDEHVRPAALPAPGGPRELARFVGDVASHPLDRTRPLWEMWVVEGLARGEVAIVAKVHHAALDGASGVEVLTQLVDLEPVPVSEPQVLHPWYPDRVPSELEMLTGALLSLARQPAVVLRAARQVVAGAVRLGRRLRRESMQAGVPFTAPRLPWNAPLTPHRVVAFVSVPLAEVRAVKEATATTVNDVVLAVVAGALRRYLADRAEVPDSPLVAAVPVSVRREGDRSAAGNRVSVLFTRLPVHVAEPAARLEAVRTVSRGAKQVHEDIGPDTLEQLAAATAPAVMARGARLYAQLRLAERVRPVINLVVSNVPGPQFPLYLAGGRLVRLYPMGPVLDGAGLNVTVISYCGRVDVGLMACRETVPDLWQLADAVPPRSPSSSTRAGCARVSKRPPRTRPPKPRSRRRRSREQRVLAPRRSGAAPDEPLPPERLTEGVGRELQEERVGWDLAGVGRHRRPLAADLGAYVDDRGDRRRCAAHVEGVGVGCVAQALGHLRGPPAHQVDHVVAIQGLLVDPGRACELGGAHANAVHLDVERGAPGRSRGARTHRARGMR